jgi:hypothetical protein
MVLDGDIITIIISYFGIQTSHLKEGLKQKSPCESQRLFIDLVTPELISFNQVRFSSRNCFLFFRRHYLSNYLNDMIVRSFIRSNGD